MNRPAILWVPHASWPVKQRLSFLAPHLTKNFDLHVITWTGLDRAGEVVNLPKLIRTQLRWTRNTEGVTLHHVPQIPGGLFSRPLRRTNDALLASAMEGIVERHGIQVVVVGRPMSPPAVSVPVAVDIVDDHSSYWRDVRMVPGIADEIEHHESLLLKAAQARFAVSVGLRDRATASGFSVELVPNGFDPERVVGGSRKRFRESIGASDSTLVVGFIGAFGEFSGLIRVVEGLADWPAHATLVVAGGGPQLAAAKRLAERNEFSSSRFLGWIDEPKDFFAGIDVGLLPFDVVPFTSMASPIKLFEYSAAGVPTISTPLEEVRRLDIPCVVVVPPSPQGIAEGVRRLAASGTSHLPRPDMSQFSWPQIAEGVSARLADLIDS